MKFEAAVKKSGLTLEQVKDFQTAARRTWDEVGGDVLTAVQESGEGDSISRSHVIEIVLDANYMDRHISDKSILSWANQPWKTAPKDLYEVKKSLILPSFPSIRYGW